MLHIEEIQHLKCIEDEVLVAVCCWRWNWIIPIAGFLNTLG
jgi:hypothetical protein